MGKTRWKIIDTRRLGKDRSSPFDGFVHILPKALESIHVMGLRCWCSPRVIWSDEGETLLVSHKNKRPGGDE